MNNWRGLTVCIVFVQALTILGQTGSLENPTSTDKILEKKVPGVELEYLTTTTMFSHSLGRVGAPGGMAAIQNCDGNSVYAWSPMGQSLRQVLDTMVQADPSYHWEVADGVINLLPMDGEPALLRTRINKFGFTDETSALEALKRLLALPEVKKGMEDLHLKPGITAISYWSSPNPKPFSVRCEGITLRQALNTIAHTQGRAIWEYVEVHCKGKDEVIIRF